MAPFKIQHKTTQVTFYIQYCEYAAVKYEFNHKLLKEQTIRVYKNLY